MADKIMFILIVLKISERKADASNMCQRITRLSSLIGKKCCYIACFACSRFVETIVYSGSVDASQSYDKTDVI